MASLRPPTKSYPLTARKALGIAVARAREAAGYAYRPAFAEAAGLSVRSILKLEQGQPVGASVYEAAARALPGWNEDTPRGILEGGDAPTVGESQPDSPPEFEMLPPGTKGLSDDERRLTRSLRAKGWPAERIADFLDELRRDSAGATDVG